MDQQISYFCLPPPHSHTHRKERQFLTPKNGRRKWNESGYANLTVTRFRVPKELKAKHLNLRFLSPMRDVWCPSRYVSAYSGIFETGWLVRRPNGGHCQVQLVWLKGFGQKTWPAGCRKWSDKYTATAMSSFWAQRLQLPTGASKYFTKTSAKAAFPACSLYSTRSVSIHTYTRANT